MTKNIFAFSALAALSLVAVSSLTGQSFWRCGVQFPPDPAALTIPVSTFDEEQWEAILADPSLRVVPVDGEAEAVADKVTSDAALEASVIEAINGLKSEDFHATGKPKVDALKAALPELASQINATLRDAIWLGLKATVEPQVLDAKADEAAADEAKTGEPSGQNAT
jgi:hypothetical protein